MGYPLIFTVIVALIIIFTIVTKSKFRGYGKDFEEYVEKEREANAVRRKPINDSDFYIPDLSVFPLKEDKGEDTAVMRTQREFLKRAENRMMSFDPPLSNAELKLRFGTLNLEHITEYEENFYQFNYAVNNWADALLEAGDTATAEKVLRGGVACGTETGKTYTMLADIYFKSNRRSDMRELYDIVKNKQMPAQEKVWGYINEYYVKMGL